MKCPHCGKPNFDWARRCDHCGVPISPSVLASVPTKGSTAPLDLADKRAILEHWHCDCFKWDEASAPTETKFHSQLQDTDSTGWKQLVDLIDRTAAEGREELAPFDEMKWDHKKDVITLPSTIGTLKSVKRLLLTASCLVRLPPEVGDMANLVELDTYTSYRLHWLPYELTRCAKLEATKFSTRALYGNYKYRPPFPELEGPLSSPRDVDLRNLPPERYGAPAITTCSVCRMPLATAGLYQAWISLKVGTDVLPLLVNACSTNCLVQLPPTPSRYVSGPHRGGLSVKQPPRWGDELRKWEG